MKLYIKNSKGTIYRVDKSSVKDKLPTPTDIARRVVLCNISKIPFSPFSLLLNKETFAKLRKEFNDAEGVQEYRVYDSSDTRVLEIIES